MRRVLLAVLFVVIAASPTAEAQTLYAATGSNCAAGKLYTVNPTTAAFTLVAPITVGGQPVSLTGLAFHPITGILYGATVAYTGCSSTSNPRSLITINPATGVGTLIGAMTAGVGDIAFGPTGTLYGWQASSGTAKSLVTINTTTGAQTQIGASGLGSTTGNALAFASGTLYLSADSDSGPLRTVNPTTGATTVGPTLTGAPRGPGEAIAAMASDNSGTLFGIDSDRSSVALTSLVVINPSTGVVTTRGTLPNDTDALAFTTVPIAPTLHPAALLGLFAALALIALLAMKTH